MFINSINENKLADDFYNPVIIITFRITQLIGKHSFRYVYLCFCVIYTQKFVRRAHGVQCKKR